MDRDGVSKFRKFKVTIPRSVKAGPELWIWNFEEEPREKNQTFKVAVIINKKKGEFKSGPKVSLSSLTFYFDSSHRKSTLSLRLASPRSLVGVIAA